MRVSASGSKLLKNLRIRFGNAKNGLVTPGGLRRTLLPILKRAEKNAKQTGKG
jgi:hypothetical protein